MESQDLTPDEQRLLEVFDYPLAHVCVHFLIPLLHTSLYFSILLKSHITFRDQIHPNCVQLRVIHLT